MTSQMFRKALITAGLLAAFGAFGSRPAMANGARIDASAVQMRKNTSTRSQRISDTWITTKVKSAFATTQGVGVTDISVDTNDGVVMLSGKVKSSAEITRAVDTARSVRGVKAVEAAKLRVVNSTM